MPNGDKRATTGTATADPGTGGKATTDKGAANRTEPSRKAAAAPSTAPIIIRAPFDVAPTYRPARVWSFEQEVIERLEKKLGARLTATPERRIFSSKLSACVMDFRRRGRKADGVTLYFTLPPGWGWQGVGKNPDFFYQNVTIRNEFQVEAERAAEAERLEKARLAKEKEDREKENERRLEENRRRQAEERERKRQAAEPKVRQLAREIIVETMFWEWGFVLGLYAGGEFKVTYRRFSEHTDSERAVSLTNSPAHRQKIERALWDAFWAESRAQTIYQVPVAAEPVAEPVAPAKVTPTQDSAAAVDCDALLARGQHKAYLECLQRQKLQVARDMKEGAMSVTEPAAEFLEAVNPYDPVNLAMMPIAGLTGKGVKAIVAAIRGKRAVRLVEWVSRRQGSRGAAYWLEGEAAQFAASQRGHHIYEYIAEDGELLYIGKSGGVTGARSWVQRLQEDHINTAWIGEARLVRVTHDLTEQEMWALEEVLIPKARANLQPGQYTRKFPQGNLSANAASALKQSQSMFVVEAAPVRSTP